MSWNIFARHRAALLAMQRAVAGLHIAPEACILLIDGNRCPALPVPSIARGEGDSRVWREVARILAKSHPRRRNSGAGYRFSSSMALRSAKAIQRFHLKGFGAVWRDGAPPTQFCAC